MSPLQMLADVLTRIFRVLSAIARRSAAGLRWLARHTYRQRSLGVAASPHLTRLLDLHAVTLAAHVAVVAALVVAPGAPDPLAWIVAGPVVAVASILGIWRPGRLTLGLLVAAQGILAVLAAQWLTSDWWLLLTLPALAIAQQLSLTALWTRHGAGWAGLGRATLAGLLLGVFTGGGGLIFGVFWAALPLWIAAILLTGGAILAIRLPDPPTHTLTALPRQPHSGEPHLPDGYAVYRPSSLDE